MPATRRDLFRLFLRERQDPEPFYRELAARSVAELPVPVAGRTVLDIGCGPGHYSRALEAAGARPISIDVDRDELFLPGGPPRRAVVGDAGRLPFRSRSVDGVFCSNVLEHVPDAQPVLREIGRVLAPEGWAWVSWTNWYSPYGGHEISPLHYLGAQRGLRVYERLTGRRPKNVPGTSLFPLHIGRMLALVDAEPSVRLDHARPRYYPGLTWITRVPGLREVATWNCVLLLHAVG